MLWAPQTDNGWEVQGTLGAQVGSSEANRGSGVHGQHRTAAPMGVGRGEGACVPGCRGSHSQRSMAPRDERYCTVSCEVRRLPGDALIELELGLGLLE